MLVNGRAKWLLCSFLTLWFDDISSDAFSFRLVGGPFISVQMLFCLSLLATPLENQLSSGGDQTCSNLKTGQATSVYAVLATEGENLLSSSDDDGSLKDSLGDTRIHFIQLLLHILNAVSKAPQFLSTWVGTSWCIVKKEKKAGLDSIVGSNSSGTCCLSQFVEI